MTRADLGLADAYIDGDISFTDKNEGLLNLFMVSLIWWVWVYIFENWNALTLINTKHFSGIYLEFALMIYVLQILIASRDSKSSISKLNKNRYTLINYLNCAGLSIHLFVVVGFRGWWTPLMFTACIGSAKYFLKHISRQNTLTQARRNISRHYELV